MNEQNAKLSILTLLEKKFNILLEITNSRNHQKSILDLSHNVLSGLNSVLRKKVKRITIQKCLYSNKMFNISKKILDFLLVLTVQGNGGLRQNKRSLRIFIMYCKPNQT